MAVDTTSIGSVYDSLEGKVKSTLDDYLTSHGLSGEDKSAMVSNVLGVLIQESVRSVAQDSVNSSQANLLDKQALEVVAETARKDSESTAQVNLLNVQKTKVEEEIDLLQTEDLIKTYYKDSIQPEEKTKLQEEIDLLQSQDQKVQEEKDLIVKQQNLTDTQKDNYAVHNKREIGKSMLQMLGMLVNQEGQNITSSPLYTGTKAVVNGAYGSTVWS